MNLRTKIIGVLIIACLVGFAFGYAYGFEQGVEWTVRKGLEFIEFEAINIDKFIDEILQYKHHIDMRSEYKELYPYYN